MRNLFFIIIFFVISFVPTAIFVASHGSFKSSIAEYTDFIATDLVYSGFDKKLEIRSFQLLLFLSLIICPILYFYGQSFFSKVIDFLLSLIKKVTPFFKETNLLFLFAIFLYLFVKDKYNLKSLLIIFSIEFVIFCYFYFRKKSQLFLGFLLSQFGIFLSCYAILSLIEYYAGGINKEYLKNVNGYNIAYISLFFSILFFTKYKLTVKTNSDFVAFFYLLCPFLLFAFLNTTYIHNGQIVDIQLHTASFNKTIEIIVFLVFLANILFLIKKQYSKFLTLTIIVISMYFSWNTPSPYFLSDMFHNGETSVPLQQLVDFQKKPWIDYYPVHGLCDYYNYSIGWLFNDKLKYSDLNFGYSLGTTIATGLVFYIYSFLFKNKYYLILLSTLGWDLNTRWYLVALSLPILLHCFNNKTFRTCLWTCIWLSLINLIWNPAFGCALTVTISFLLLLKIKDIKFHLRIKLSYLDLLQSAILLCFIIASFSILQGLLKYVLLTSRTSIETHGTPIIQGINKRYFLMTFLYFFIIPLCYFLAYKQKKLTNNVFYSTLIFSVFLLSFSNYFWLRFDNGARCYAINYLLCFVIFPLLFINKYPKIVYCVIAIGVLSFIPSIKEQGMFYKQEVSLADNTIRLTTQNTLGNIDNVVITKEDYNFLKKFNNYINTQPHDSLLNLSGRQAIYAIFNIECPNHYVTTMNNDGLIKQNDTVGSIMNKESPIIYMGNFFYPNHHNYYAYTNFIKQGYVFDKIINDTIFLIKSNKRSINNNTLYRTENLTLKEIKQFFNRYLPKNDLELLPTVWASNIDKVEKKNIKHKIKITNNGDNIAININFTKEISLLDFDFLAINLGTTNKKNKHQVTLYVPETDKEGSEIQPFSYISTNRTALIPIWSNISWLTEEKIKNIKVIISNTKTEKITPQVNFMSFKQIE